MDNSKVDLLVSVLEEWIIEILGEVEDIEDTIIEALFSSHEYKGDDANDNETADSLRPRFE